MSGHKYGLVYPGVGWVLWREQADLPKEPIFGRWTTWVARTPTSGSTSPGRRPDRGPALQPDSFGPQRVHRDHACAGLDGSMVGRRLGCAGWPGGGGRWHRPAGGRRAAGQRRVGPRRVRLVRALALTGLDRARPTAWPPMPSPSPCSGSSCARASPEIWPTSPLADVAAALGTTSRPTLEPPPPGAPTPQRTDAAQAKDEGSPWPGSPSPMTTRKRGPYVEVWNLRGGPPRSRSAALIKPAPPNRAEPKRCGGRGGPRMGLGPRRRPSPRSTRSPASSTPTRRSWPILTLTPSTCRCPTACTDTGPSPPCRPASTCCAKSPSMANADEARQVAEADSAHPGPRGHGGVPAIRN